MRSYKVLAILISTTFSLNHLHAQSQGCLSDIKMEKIYAQSPQYKIDLEKSFEDFYSNRKRNNSRSKAAYNIPVHVIVVHPTGVDTGIAENITEARINEQIAVLNRDFNRLNEDASNTPDIYAPGTMDISFCLASIDPQGMPTSGITRYATDLDFEENEIAIKDSTRWSRDEYLNIWVAPLSEGKYGFAYLATISSLPNESTDGVVVGTPYFGGITTSEDSIRNMGRTCVHEVGHFFGLRHVWGVDGCGETDDDGLADTPKQDTAHTTCATHPFISCDTIGDMFMNYMDLTPDSCKNAFTVDQVDYMISVLENSRFDLGVSKVLTTCSPVEALRFVSFGGTNPLCFNGYDGQLHATVVGGVEPYTYSVGETTQDTSTFIDYAPGSYTYTATDAEGASVTVIIELGNPNPINFRVTNEIKLGCSPDKQFGAVSVIATGGTLNGVQFLYNINNGIFSQSNIFDQLPQGDYTLVARDNNLCEDTLIYTVEQANDMVVSVLSKQEVSCFEGNDGQINLFVQGGTSPFQYSIDSIVLPSNSAQDLSAGAYAFNIIDVNDCRVDTTISITEPSKLKFDILQVQDIPCVGADASGISVRVSGGVEPYNIKIGGVTYQGQRYGPLEEGDYEVTVEDSYGCKIDTTVTIGRIDQLEITIISLKATCSDKADGGANILVEGGSGQYNLLLDGFALGDDGIIRGLMPGEYEIFVEDRMSKCKQSKTLVVAGPSPLEIEIVSVVPEFTGGKKRIELNATGGTPPYMYSLDGINEQSSEIFSNQDDGDYNPTVTDINGCQDSEPLRLLATEDDLLIEQIKIYPNPFSSTFEVSIPVEFEATNVSLYNINGQLIQNTKTNKIKENKIITTFSVDNIQESIYFLKIASSSRTIFRKVIKI